jgi:hypothetical protein
MTGCLVRISPLDPETGNRVDVYLSSFGHRADAAANGLDGRVWEPAITQRPTLAMTAWNGDFTAAIEPGAATLPVNLEIAAQTWPNIGRYGWTGAPIAIFGGKPGDAWPWETLFAGRVRSYSGTYPRLSLQAQVDTEPFDADVLTARYAGTGGAEGGDDIKNRLKPLVVGWAKSVEPVLVDAVNDVWQFSGHGPIEAVTTLYERASAFGASDGDHADYAALVAASIAPGHWATCLAGGMIRLGAPAYGVITGDIRGHKTGASTPRLTGAVIALLADIADIDPALIVDSTLTALNAAVPYPINIVLSDQVSFIDIARRLALACNWQAGVSLTGKFFGAGVSLAGPPALTLDAQGKASPQVLQSEELHVSPPYSSTILGADRCWRTHTASEIAYVEGLTGYLTHPSHSVAADPDGNVSDFTGVGGSFIVERDGSPLTTGVVFSVASEAGVDVDIDADTGEYSVLGMAPGGQGIAVFKAVLGAETLFAGYSISKSVAGATAKAFAIKGGGNFRYNSAGAIYAGEWFWVLLVMMLL